jgi:hypothetical protein
MHGVSVNAEGGAADIFPGLTSPHPWGVLTPRATSGCIRTEGFVMLELSLWVLGGVFVLGLVACRLARKPRKQHDMELLDFDFDKSKIYEKDGRKYPFSY